MLAKKINDVQILISKVLIKSSISRVQFASVNVLKEYDDMRKKIKNSNNKYVVIRQIESQKTFVAI